MKLLFKQRAFSWFDSFDIYTEDGRKAYEVKGQLSWGHRLKIYSTTGIELGEVKEKLFKLSPTFELYEHDQAIGEIKKKLFKMFKSEYEIESFGWTAKGNFRAWNYEITDANGNLVAKIDKELLNWTDTYSMDIANPEDALHVLMFVIAIDAEKATRDDAADGPGVSLGGFKLKF